MFEIIKLIDKNDYFLTLSARPSRGVYMCRLTGFGSGMREFLAEYVGECKKYGIYIKDGIKNPDAADIGAYRAEFGDDFSLDAAFIAQRLGKIFPKAGKERADALAKSLFSALGLSQKNGATESMLKNIYVKYTCLFRYKFEPIINTPVSEKPPKILYEGAFSKNDLKFLKVICAGGFDLLAADFGGNNMDDSIQTLPVKNPMAVPRGFILRDADIKKDASPAPEPPVRERTPDNLRAKPSASEKPRADTDKRIYPFSEPSVKVCVNEWMKKDAFESVAAGHNERGSGYRSVFAYIRGVWDGYPENLQRTLAALEMDGRIIVVEENTIPPPDVSEVGAIGKRDYGDEDELINKMCGKISFPENAELERLLRRAFYDIIRKRKDGFKKRNAAVCVLCFIKRYIPRLFKDWRLDAHPAFIYWGYPKNENEADFLKILSRACVDVLILDCEGKEISPVIEDTLLLKKEYSKKIPRKKFSESVGEPTFTTAAYDAERELDGILYRNTGLYRAGQFDKAKTITLKTTFDEIKILWNEDARYRPNFGTFDSGVTLPVIFAKISGVAGGAGGYFKLVAALSKNAFVINGFPYISPDAENKIKPYAAGFYKNGALLRDKIKNSPCYRYGFINGRLQEHMLDKLETLISSGLIVGVGASGAEYAIISAALNLEREIMRMIQSFDFTKSVPKIVITAENENLPTLEDAAALAFLNYVGFDIVIFSPAGYQSVEKYYTKDILQEHIIGEYVYDIQNKKPKGILGEIFKGGFTFGRREDR